MKKAFTLIELLVVIAIIGVLASVVLVSVGGSRKQADDAKLKTDASQLMTAYELCYSMGETWSNNWKTPGNAITCKGDTVMQKVPTGLSISGTTYSDYKIVATLSDSSTYTCEQGSCH